MKSTSIKTVAVLTSGGDAPGLNAAIRALCVSGKNNYGMKFIGVRNGYRGLINNDTFNFLFILLPPILLQYLQLLSSTWYINIQADNYCLTICFIPYHDKISLSFLQH